MGIEPDSKWSLEIGTSRFRNKNVMIHSLHRGSNRLSIDCLFTEGLIQNRRRPQEREGGGEWGNGALEFASVSEIFLLPRGDRVGIGSSSAAGFGCN